MFAQAHALLIGVANYRHVRKLSGASLHDAQDLHDLLTEPEYAGYPASQVTLLLDEAATKPGILTALESLAKRCDSDSTVFISFSGHGGRLISGIQRGEYLLPIEAQRESETALAESSISTGELTQALRRIPARKLVLVLDCCHAGGIGQLRSVQMDDVDFQPGFSKASQNELSAGRGRALLLASRDSEPAIERRSERNGLFTKHLLAGLRGGALRTGGLIRIFDLFEYVQTRVTAEEPGQHPVFKAEVEENFPIARCPAPAVPPVAIPPVDGFKRDVFLHALEQGPDRIWVRKVLRPALEQRGLRVWDSDQFHLAMPRIKEMEKAVESCRYTVAVLSDAYLKSGLAELGDLMAQHLGAEESRYRLLAVLREPCTPRLGIRIAPLLDLSIAEDFAAQVDRLAYSLQQPLPSK